jgi:DNA-binding CsgD family transcriptional regulator
LALRNKRQDPAIPDMAQVSRLSEEQRLCLRGVLAHLTSAQIAAETDLPVGRVDSLLRAAVRELGVASRTEAALLVAAVEGCLPTLAPAAPQPALKRTSPSAPGRTATTSLGFEPFTPRTKFIPDETALHHEVKEHYEDTVPWGGPLDLRSEPGGVETFIKSREPFSRNRLGIAQRVLFILLVSFASSVMLASLVMAIATVDSLR